jgi:hypothetical protein
VSRLVFFLLGKQNDNIIREYKEYSIPYNTKHLIKGFEYKLAGQYTIQPKDKEDLRPIRPLNQYQEIVLISSNSIENNIVMQLPNTPKLCLVKMTYS